MRGEIRARLTAILIPSADRERTLRSPSVIGSDAAPADVVIDDPTISARHARC